VRDQLSADPPWLIEPPGYGETRLRGQKIYAKVDVLIRLPGETLILDWKSGRQDAAKHTRQLLGYAAWAEHNLQIPAEEIRCVLAYLQPDSAELDGLAVEVAAEIQQMQSLCKDPERNIPLEKAAFPQTENLGSCRQCQFRELCDRVDG
jgi:predicted RecB family nuclease